MERATLVALLWAFAGLGCSTGGNPAEPFPEDTCSGFGDWSTSAYVLPYPVGTSYQVGQANCSGFGHSGYWKYGYDFLMPIGTPVSAARAGTVLHSVDGAQDGDPDNTNLVTIEHSDGTVALYSHLTFAGALVDAGDAVRQGQVIGLSGNTGFSTEPHLHFSLHPCGALQGLAGGDHFSCPTLPVTFRNTEPNPQGLEVGRSYVAGPH